MSYIKNYLWKIVPETIPVVRKSCPKCNEKTNYINSKKFRVNANKNNIDIWLIYQCEKCKTSWNMEICERAKAGSIDTDKFKMFMKNDEELADEYGFNIDIHNKNKVELRIKDVLYDVKKVKLDDEKSATDEMRIKIECKYPCEVRVDKLLSDNLMISRSQIKKMHEGGKILIENNKNSLKSRVEDGMIIRVI